MKVYAKHPNSRDDSPYSLLELRQHFLAGKVTEEWVCRRDGETEWKPITEVLYADEPMSQPTQPIESSKALLPTPPHISTTVTHGQGVIIIFLLLALLGFPLFQLIHPRWEYRTEELPSTSISRTGAGAAQPSTILLQVSKLDAMGEQGWELVGTFLEMETAYPNFGNDDYVTGLRENIRPQKLVLIFKRRVTIF